MSWCVQLRCPEKAGWFRKRWRKSDRACFDRKLSAEVTANVFKADFPKCRSEIEQTLDGLGNSQRAVNIACPGQKPFKLHYPEEAAKQAYWRLARSSKECAVTLEGASKSKRKR